MKRILVLLLLAITVLPSCCQNQNTKEMDSKTFLQLASDRFSVRKYANTPVEQAKIDAILEAARLAPTACNNQPQKIYVLRSPEAIAKINELSSCAYNAPVVFVVCSDEEITWKNDTDGDHSSGDVDVAIVGTHMMLEAWEQGLGSCWVGLFDPQEVAEAFGIPQTQKVVMLLPVGYAAEGVEPSPLHFESRTLDEMVIYL